jgi:hypothetical protein
LHTGGDGEGPIQVKLEMDYSEFEPHEMLELRRLWGKAMETPKRKRQGPALLIEAEPEDTDDGEP